MGTVTAPHPAGGGHSSCVRSAGRGAILTCGLQTRRRGLSPRPSPHPPPRAAGPGLACAVCPELGTCSRVSSQRGQSTAACPAGRPALSARPLGSHRRGSGGASLGKVSGCCRPLPGSSEPGRVSQPLPTACPQMESFSHYAGRAERLRCSLQGLGARAGGCLAFRGDICSPRSLSFGGRGPRCPASGRAPALTPSRDSIVTASPVKQGRTSPFC